MMARPGAGVAGFPGRGGAAPRHRCRDRRLAASGPVCCPRPLALSLEKPAAAAAPAPTQTKARSTAKPEGDGLLYRGLRLSPTCPAARTAGGGGSAQGRGASASWGGHSGRTVSNQPLCVRGQGFEDRPAGRRARTAAGTHAGRPPGGRTPVERDTRAAAAMRAL